MVDVVDYDTPITVSKYNFRDLNEQIASEGYYGDINSKPEIEVALFSMQESYYYATTEEEKHTAWVKMFELTKKYSTSLIQKRLKNKIYLQPDEIEEKAANCALNFMSQYIERPGFHVGASFAGTINPKVLEVMYKQVPEDNHKSLNEIISQDSENSIEYLQEKLKFKNIFQQEFNEFESKESLKEVLLNLLNEFDGTLASYQQKIYIRLWISLLLKKPKNKHIKNSFRNKCCNFKMNKIIDLFELELYNRLNAG